ncbi:hypothetical protein PUN28_005525 [Cardiocondyla obscurior]|uniref:Uncharacterized protein n=1 Tax=Cardiocondyla obscurior TaxID=286306 RepID=A0AAW2GGE5_9HYME
MDRRSRASLPPRVPSFLPSHNPPCLSIPPTSPLLRDEHFTSHSSTWLGSSASFTPPTRINGRRIKGDSLDVHAPARTIRPRPLLNSSTSRSRGNGFHRGAALNLPSVGLRFPPIAK